VPIPESAGLTRENSLSRNQLRAHTQPDSARNYAMASVYNVNTKGRIAPSEPVEDIEQGEEIAAAHAKVYLKHAADLELPPLKGKASRSR